MTSKATIENPFERRDVTPLEEIAEASEREVVRLMRQVSPAADPVALIPDVPPSRIPRHVAIIMDGNGRWAVDRGFPRAFGHRNGARAVRAAIRAAGRLGIECLTLYSFSAENWKRPSDEVSELMSLYCQYMDSEREELVRENIRFRQIGRRDGLPVDAVAALDRTLEATRDCTGPMLCLAVNYSSRLEIVDACRAIASEVREGRLDVDAIDESSIAAALHTAGIPDPDLLIRTAGEMRISNFLLWQISYSEIYVTNEYWPDFDEQSFVEALRAYAARRRRFGGLDAGDTSD